MNKVIAFAGSNSKTSINKQLATYAAKQLEGAQIEILDLNDYEMPLYGIDHENEHGIPQAASDFLQKIKGADGIVLSLAEHNGAYSTAFKNIFDWMSRIDGKLWSEVPMLLMATSPGGRGGKSVLEVAKNRFPYMGGNIVETFSLPFFSKNFTSEGIQDQDLETELNEAVNSLSEAINN